MRECSGKREREKTARKRKGDRKNETRGARRAAEERHFMRFFRRGVSFAIIYAGRQLEK